MITRPLEHLNVKSKRYPNAWKWVEYSVANRGATLPDWPKWCFVPTQCWKFIVAERYNHVFEPWMVAEILALASIGTWRYTKGIYRFNDDLLSALVKTDQTGNMPSEVLLRLPEYCVYVEKPCIHWDKSPIEGFWAKLGWSSRDECELHLLLDLNDSLTPLSIPVGNWTLLEAVKQAVSETYQSTFLRNHSIQEIDDLVREAANNFQPLLSLILYLCSDDPEIENDSEPKSPSKPPGLTKTRKGWRLFPPDRCRVWHVGRAMGETLRRASANEQRESKGVRPHLRRPHWHGFWTGPLNGERRFGYKWLPTIMVRGRIDENDANGRPRGRGIREEKA